MQKQVLSGIAALLVLVSIGGCGGSERSIPASAVPPEAVAATGGVDGAVPDAEYIIGPGDGLNIFVWRNPDLSATVVVRPDGRISIPLVEDMQAVGKTPTQLGLDIEAVLSEYVRMPDVTVIMSGFGVGAYGNQIRVVGAGASQAQSIPYRQGLTLLDVVIEVGLTQYAAGNRARLIRREGGQYVERRIRLDRLVNRGDLSENVALLPGDVLVVPQTRF